MEITRGVEPGEILVRDGERTERMFAIVSRGKTWVFHDGRTYEIADEAGDSARGRGGPMHGAITAPMPATVIAVKVAAGDEVKRGDVLIVLEAMKMELPVRAPGEGRIAAVHCRPGDLVQPDVSLVDFA
jgi:3-methylcrotonyl-CoA carboxylase alpha subunit